MNPELLNALVAAGILDDQLAAVITRQLDPDAARAWAESQMTEAMFAALQAQQARLLDLVRAGDNAIANTALRDFWRNENDTLFAAMRGTLARVASERVTTAAVLSGQVNTFDLINEQMLDWVDTYYTLPDPVAYGSIPNLNDVSRRQFADEFVLWQRGQVPVSSAPGLPGLIDQLEPIFGYARAERIGITETTRIFVEALRQAEADNEFTVGFTYLIAADEGVCPICRPGAGLFAAKDATTFPDGGGFPPRHVRCRCHVVPETTISLAVRQGTLNDLLAPDSPAEAMPDAPTAAEATTLQPVGTPVSNALSVAKGKHLAAIEEAIRTIDQVHGDGNLPNIPVKQGRMTKTGAYFKYSDLPRGRVPREIKVSTTLTDTEAMFAMAHEVGHFLDLSGLNLTRSAKPTPEMQAWLDAVATSETVKKLQAWYRKPPRIKRTNAAGMSFDLPADRRYLGYLLQKNELWARSYAQYVAAKSGNQAMLQGLRDQMSWDPMNELSQWSDEEFAPIEAAIDNLFRTAGWIA